MFRCIKFFYQERRNKHRNTEKNMRYIDKFVRYIFSFTYFIYCKNYRNVRNENTRLKYLVNV